mmetsp:Transcript_23980/g.36540  ORF Transcript_23980/g.36540 Transcript_23980/m.36540 type:complete len:102 (-) Transcript_23980:995-1300(-)
MEEVHEADSAIYDCMILSQKSKSLLPLENLAASSSSSTICLCRSTGTCVWNRCATSLEYSIMLRKIPNEFKMLFKSSLLQHIVCISTNGKDLSCLHVMMII